MPTGSQCPDPIRWGDLLDSRLPEPMANSLTSHLEGCPGCQSTLERLTAGEPTWVEAARAFEERPRPELRRAMEQLKAAGGPGLDTPGPTTIATLPFLRPSPYPEYVGRLGSYEVLGVVGRGGMGVVLKAFDPALRRPVAIKVLAPQWASHEQARQRFHREAQAAAQVRHENVVAIHAVEEADGLPYLVMEYVPGVSLQQRLDRDGPLEVEEILRIGAQAAAGLAAAHAKDLIHRDIKPANILLDKAGNVRLTDFGLARAVDDTSLTQSGVIAGTPQYMAPEQARGAVLDHRADLFSLGSVLYAMCTGRPPFRAPSTVAVLKRVCDETPVDVRNLNPDVPAWLAEIIDKLHAKSPRDRFQTADQVARLLGQHLRHLRSPDQFEKPGPVDGRPAAARRWAILLVAPGVLIPALVIGGVVWLLGSKRDTNPPPDPRGEVPVAKAPADPGPPDAGPPVVAGPAPRAKVREDAAGPDGAQPGPAPVSVDVAPREVPQVPVARDPAPKAAAAQPDGDVFFEKTLAELDDGNFFTRKTALERLVTMRPNDQQRPRVTRKLVELLKKADNRDRSIRYLAITALGVWGSENEVPDLIKAIEDPDVWTRKEALKVIGRFKDKRSLPAVIRSFREHQTQKEAAQALREMGPMAEQDVLAIVKEPADLQILFLKQAAIEVLADIGTDKSVPGLRKVLATTDFHEASRLRKPAQDALDAIAGRKKKK